jgi:molecular chaperone DnaJ
MSDYYKTLGLAKGASVDEIKKSYKKLAKKYHPDVSQEKDAEKKFKEVVEAYQVLSDPEKKQNYDNYGDAYKNFQGHSGFGGFGGASQGQRMDFDFEDIFNQFAGMNFDLGDLFGRRKQRSRKDYGQNIKVNMNLTFEEAAFGITKEISFDRITKCSHCKGTGAKDGKLKTCNTCKGHGRVIRQQRTPFGVFQSQTTCHTCRGEGKTAEKQCSDCDGNGFITKKKKLKVTIPEGINNGNHLRLHGKGHEGKDGAGDVYVVIFVETHEIFKRDEIDIYAELPISFTEAALGATIEVPTLKGKADLKVPAGTQTGTIFRLKGKGIKKINSSSHGDEYIKVIVETPKKVSKKQREILNKMEKEEQIAKKRKSFFKKILGKF